LIKKDGAVFEKICFKIFSFIQKDILAKYDKNAVHKVSKKLFQPVGVLWLRNQEFSSAVYHIKLN
jgi:hypothetical protein